MIISPIKTRVFREGDDLLSFIIDCVPRVADQTVIVVTSKIVALAERRTAVVKNQIELKKIILAESQFAYPTKHVWLTVKDGIFMAQAGVDQSNANGKVVLLPKNSYQTAKIIRQKLIKHYGVRYLGVLIVDSRTTPLRAGVVGQALGYAGLNGIRDYRGTPDIYGRKMKISRTNVADCLATAAVLVMGEGQEKQPLAVIQKAPIKFCRLVKIKELNIAPSEDMYQPLYAKMRF